MKISVDLIKGTYYLNGENLIAQIIFQKYATKDKRKDHNILAWACAQIHCQCSFDDDKVKANLTNKNDKILPHLGLTSLIPNYGEKGFCVYASEPKILVCDLDLKTGETYEYLYQETIPYEAFPSYRGTLCKYSYKLTITAQYLSSPVNFVRIPFKVLILQGLSQELMNDETYRDNSPANPFLSTQNNEISDKSDSFSLEKAMALIQDIVSFKNIRHYNIMSENEKVCKLSIGKTFYGVGDYINVYLDFSETAVTCLELYVCLQNEEELISDTELVTHIKHPQRFTSANASKKIVYSGDSYSEMRYYTLNCRFLPIHLAIPITSTPTFTTNILKHSWKIHFEFTFSHSKSLSRQVRSDKTPKVPKSADSPLRRNEESLEGWETPRVQDCHDNLEKVDSVVGSDDGRLESNDTSTFQRSQEISVPQSRESSNEIALNSESLHSNTLGSNLESHSDIEQNVSVNSAGIAKQQEERAASDERITSTLEIPLSVNAETMVWDLPIKLFPSHPLAISSQFPLGKISTVI